MRLCLLLLASLSFVAIAAADEKKDGPAVKEIALPAMKGFPTTKFDQPAEIATTEALAKAFPDADVRTAIEKEVDFAKQKLLYFAWSGSGQDKLTPGAGDKGAITFTYKRGLTRDLRGHRRLFAIAKGATWSVERAK